MKRAETKRLKEIGIISIILVLTVPTLLYLGLVAIPEVKKAFDEETEKRLEEANARYLSIKQELEVNGFTVQNATLDKPIGEVRSALFFSSISEFVAVAKIDNISIIYYGPVWIDLSPNSQRAYWNTFWFQVGYTAYIL